MNKELNNRIKKYTESKQYHDIVSTIIDILFDHGYRPVYPLLPIKKIKYWKHEETGEIIRNWNLPHITVINKEPFFDIMFPFELTKKENDTLEHYYAEA